MLSRPDNLDLFRYVCIFCAKKNFNILCAIPSSVCVYVYSGSTLGCAFYFGLNAVGKKFKVIYIRGAFAVHCCKFVPLIAVERSEEKKLRIVLLYSGFCFTTQRSII